MFNIFDKNELNLISGGKRIVSASPDECIRKKTSYDLT
ncbi:MAG: hypothetical protein ACD_26C00065G0001, partial [uncultured bacterium]